MMRENLITPATEDIPPYSGDIDLAGVRCPDIARYLNVRSALAPTLSPDGSQVAFLTSITGTPQVWVTQADGARGPNQITFGESVSFVEWSPAGDWIVYGADRSGNEQQGFYLLSPDGTRERELLAASGSFQMWGAWSPDGFRVAYSAVDPDTYNFNIYVIDLTDPQPRCMYKGEGGTYVANWRPDGSGLLLIKVRGADALDVLYLDLETGQLDILLQPDEPAAYVSFSWTPDGQGFYMATNQDRDFGGLAFYDFIQRELRWIETPDRDVEKVALSRDGRYLAWVENDQGGSELRIRDLETGFSEGVIDLPHGVINWIKWASKAQRLAIQLSSSKVPGDIWVYDSKSSLLTRATSSSLAGLDPCKFIEPATVSFPSHDGETVFGLVYLPEQASQENKPPVILHLHGGPTMQARPGFEAFLQYMLARGYAIFDLNYRGSIGFGKRYMRLDNGQLRLNAIKDIGSAIDWLVRTYPVDGSRIVAMGESYGGFMSLASLTQFAEKFQAGIVFAGVSNWLTALENALPQLKASDRAEYGDISDPSDREFLRQLSPITHIDSIKSPLMVVHGANDPRNPVVEADQIVSAIRERRGEVKYLRFPDEGHGIRKLSNRIIAYRLAAQFLEHTIGRGIVDCAALPRK